MKIKSRIAILSILLTIGISRSEQLNLPPLTTVDPFTPLDSTVGYIQKENGEKFLVVETPEGTKLVKVKTDPKKIIEKNTK